MVRDEGSAAFKSIDLDAQAEGKGLADLIKEESVAIDLEGGPLCVSRWPPGGTSGF